MERLIATDDLIKEAEKMGVKFGKGDPYNRIRYYTKMGWLPHMVRKEGKGNFPNWALDRLVMIERLKDKNFSNEDITKKIEESNRFISVKNVLWFPESRIRLVTYISFALLLFIVSSELNVFPIGISKKLLTQSKSGISNQILSSGNSFMPAGSVKIFVKEPETTVTSKIYVTFNQNFTPAARYWVSDKIPFKGFYVELDAPTVNNTEFSWWITN